MSSIAHPVPYQGSKRKLAPAILGYFPDKVRALYEPFAGSAAVTLATAAARRAQRHVISDSLESLVGIWSLVLVDPAGLADEYEALWRRQRDDPRAFYDAVRERFNASGEPACLLFLLARCVKGAVRFNAGGQFNQSPDNRRLGARPDGMRTRIMGAHHLLSGRTEAVSGDYAQVLARARAGDLIYMDPPYQGTSGQKDRRYHRPLDLERFIQELDALNARGIDFVISLDGRCGTKAYGTSLPSALGLHRIELHAGRSSQATLNGQAAQTYESLYLSPGLQPRL